MNIEFKYNLNDEFTSLKGKLSDIPDKDNVIFLSLQSNNIQTFNSSLIIKFLPNLQILDLRDNNLTSFNGKGLENLKQLDIMNNKIFDLDIETLINLELLIAGHNNLNSFNFKKLINLKELYLQYNYLTNFDIKLFPNLQVLDLHDNKLTNLEGLNTLLNLKELTLRHNLFLSQKIIKRRKIYLLHENKYKKEKCSRCNKNISYYNKINIREGILLEQKYSYKCCC